MASPAPATPFWFTSIAIILVGEQECVSLTLVVGFLSQGRCSCEEGGVRRADCDDAGLLVAAAGGDDRAFAEFYRRWLPLVTGYHLRRTRSRELAFDLTAETFAAVVSDMRRFDPARGSAAGWLFEIAEHKLLDSRRRARVESSARARLGHEPLTLEDHDLRRVEELASLGDRDRLDRLLAQLPAPQRDAVRARVVDERSYAEIAGEMACSEAVVRQRVHRGLSRLRQRLRETS